MLAVLEVTFPFFALVFAGWLAGRRRWLPLEAIPGLNTFVLYFALPCMLYRFGAGTPIAQLVNPGVIAVWLVCALVMVGFVVSISLDSEDDDRPNPVRWNDASFGALVGAFPNTGFMGVPLLIALLGPRAAGPTIVTIMIDMVITTSLCIGLSRLDANGDGGAARAAIGRALKGIAVNPLPWSILLGALASWARFEPYAPVARTMGLLADSASPVALFTIGAVLARSQLQARTQADADAGHHPPRGVFGVSFAKLFLHPLLVLLVGATAIRFGLALDRFALTVLVLIAALPSASNVSMLAERFGADNGRIARIILVTTAAAFFTFSGAVALLAP